MQDAFKSGILSVNHRSPECVEMVRNTINLLHKKLDIPADYSVYFISSATEAWEIIAQSLVKENSFHVYNGAFGKKWFEYTQKLIPGAKGYAFGLNENLANLSAEIRSAGSEAEVICITQNETSNGTQVLVNRQKIAQNQESLIAVDATSSMAGITFDWTQGDIWFTSVQKCLGLPAGAGIMICSPKALKKAEETGENKHYNSLLFIHENFAKFQTHYTPNVLNIYLLNRVLEEIQEISYISDKIRKQADDWYSFFENSSFKTSLLVENNTVRSDTVIAVKGDEELIKTIKNQSKTAGITLGNGYGDWKNNTFRIANFPAIDLLEIEKLKNTLVQILG